MKVLTNSLLRQLMSALMFLVATGFILTTEGAGSANATTVPHCTVSSLLSAKFIGPNGAATWFYFLIAFTNSSATACSFSGVPHAQAVKGPSDILVGSPARYGPIEGVPRGTVVLRAHGGKAYVEYYVINETDWTRSQCRPATANGVVLRPLGTRSFYIPISRAGATLVCTKQPSTAVGPLSSKTY